MKHYIRTNDDKNQKRRGGRRDPNTRGGHARATRNATDQGEIGTSCLSADDPVDSSPIAASLFLKDLHMYLRGHSPPELRFSISVHRIPEVRL